MSEETGTPVVDTINQIHEKAKTSIAGSNGTIIDAIINKMVTIETERRIDIAYKCFKKLEDMQKQFKGINRPDTRSYAADGTEIMNYSEGRMGQIKKDKKNLDEFSAALEKAFNENTADAYDKLNQKFNQLSSGDKGEGKQGS